jgi:hypothetical protein
LDESPPLVLEQAAPPASELTTDTDIRVSKARERWVWGIVDLRAFAIGEQPAPNGQEFKPLFALDFDFNLWLWRAQGLYLFSDAHFWGQRAAPGITNPTQGAFDFSKREFDLDAGLAWNYFGLLEARIFAYSLNNLNRGDSAISPSGYADGVGLENRWYFCGSYANLRNPDFDVSRANFLSFGFYPTKDLPDGNGNPFKPGPFVRAYLTLDLCPNWCYVYLDAQGVATRAGTPRTCSVDAGIALRPLTCVPGLELRAGSADSYDLRLHEPETSVYGAVRFNY